MRKRAASRKGFRAVVGLISCSPDPDLELPLAPLLDRHQPLHFIGVGGIGMSALALIPATTPFWTACAGSG
jgi:hypothetical protein